MMMTKEQKEQITNEIKELHRNAVAYRKQGMEYLKQTDELIKKCTECVEISLAYYEELAEYVDEKNPLSKKLDAEIKQAWMILNALNHSNKKN